MNPTRRKLLRLLAVVTPALAVAAACTFPNVSFSEGNSADGGMAETGTSGGEDSGPDVIPNIPFDGSAEAAARADGEAPVDQSACATSWKCDCDKDGYLDDECVRKEVEAGVDGGFEAGSRAGDCDDLDPVRHPGSDFRADAPRPGAPGVPGDWDCDGVVTRAPQKVECNPPAPLTGGCSGGRAGFFVDTACGAKNDVYECPTRAVGSGPCSPLVSTTEVTATCK